MELNEFKYNVKEPYENHQVAMMYEFYYNFTDDPYNAKVYLDAEVFYEDNYNDFDGYEDAEDYYEEWGE